MLEVKMTPELKKSIMSGVKIYDVVSPWALEYIAESIVSDELENLENRTVEELEEFFEYKTKGIHKMPSNSRQRFLEVKAREWGFQAMRMDVQDWLDHFVDYLDYLDYETETASAVADREIREFEESLTGKKIMLTLV